MSRKGQALIEFIIILPIFLFILFAIIDFGLIYSKKTNLENIVNDIVTMYEKDEPYEKIDQFIKKEYPKTNLQLKNEDNKFVSVIVSEELNILTPGLNLILANPYIIEAKRVIYYE